MHKKVWCDVCEKYKCKKKCSRSICDTCGKIYCKKCASKCQNIMCNKDICKDCDYCEHCKKVKCTSCFKKYTENRTTLFYEIFSRYNHTCKNCSSEDYGFYTTYVCSKCLDNKRVT